jgi:pimeloyl-ACP methyl ester carboxylesterase
MLPWPALQPFARRFALPRAGLELYLFDTAPASTGVPVLMVHGLGDEADTWRHVLPEVAVTRRVIAVDLPGFGRSGPAAAYTLPFLRDVLMELLERLEIGRVRLVGHSLGAMAVHFTALSAPERIESLVLVGGSLASQPSRIDAGTLTYLIPGLGEWRYNRLRRDPDAAYRSLEPFYADLEALPREDRDFLYRRVNERVWSDTQRDAFLGTMRGLARWLPGECKAAAAQLGSLDVPTSVVWGDEDLINPASGAAMASQAQPGAALVLVPAAGHNIQQERPEHVVTAILA